MTSLIIAFYNANSIRTQRSGIINFLFTYSVNVLLVNETSLKEGNYFNIPNYKCIRKDREQRGSGTAMLIKHSIVCDKLDLPNFNTFECCGIILSRGADKLHLVALYKPLSSRMEETEMLRLFFPNTHTIANTLAGAVAPQT